MKFFSEHSRVSEKERARCTQKLFAYRAQLSKIVHRKRYESPESSLALPFDSAQLVHCEGLIKKIGTQELRFIFVIGIGGSNLGAKAVYEALHGYTDGIFPPRAPRMFFLDTLDGELLTALLARLIPTLTVPEEVLILCVSKSGTTTESMGNYALLHAALEQRMLQLSERTIMITDEGTPLWEYARTHHIAVFAIPELVGGRYSVFSAAGLLPLLAAGVKVRDLLAGAREATTACLASHSVNPALRSASTLAILQKKGFLVHDTFLFHPELESLGKWYRQLAAESLGKEGARGGMLPTVSIGSTDLHSLAQFYLGGPRLCATTFVTAPHARTPKIEQNYAPSAEGIAGLRAGEVMDAITHGVMRAYTRASRPWTHVAFGSLSAPELGFFMQWKMIETMFLGVLLGVNAFDQPHVELYKKETRKILQERV